MRRTLTTEELQFIKENFAVTCDGDVCRLDKRGNPKSWGNGNTHGYYTFGMRFVKWGKMIQIPAHQIAYFLHHDEWAPDNMEIDHVDRNKLNNCFKNLRCVTRASNIRNSKLSAANKTGFKGVYQRASGKFIAAITIARKQTYLGAFDTAEEAAVAFATAALIVDPEHYHLP